MGRLGLFIPLGIFIAMAVLFWVGLGKEDKTSLPSPLVGKSFPEFQAVTLETGDAVNVSALPQVPHLVNVWATWCPTCKQEHAFLNQLAEQGITIVGINYKDETELAQKWLKDYGNPYQFNVEDPNGQLGLELGVYGAPETYLVDSSGVIRAKHIGDLNPRVWTELEKQFKAME